MLAMLVIGTGEAAAAACTTGTLGDYVGLGAAGCDISADGGSIHVGDFAVLPGPAAATPIDATAISVAPLLGAGFPGLLFGGPVSAAAGQFLDIVFGFTVSGSGLSRASLLLADSPAPNGIVTAVENLCADGSFSNGPGTCSNMEFAQTVFASDLLALPGDESASTTFPLAALLGVVVDIGVEGFSDPTTVTTLTDVGAGAAAGPAQFGSLAARFEPARVPEPATAGLALLALGLVGASRRKSAAK